MINYLVIEQSQYFFIMNFGNDTWHQDFNHILTNLSQHLFVSLQLSFFGRISRGYKLVMLGRNHNRINAYRLAVIIVFNSNLALGVGTEISHHFPFTTDFGQYHQQFMSQVQRQRHIIFRFIGSITKHHSLVACPLIHRVLAFHATVNVRTLFVNGREYAARVSFEHIFALGIADTVNHFTCNALQIYIRLGFHFSSQYHLSGSHQGFASYFRTGVKRQQFVKHSVRYLIGHFVGVSFRHRFGCE